MKYTILLLVIGIVLISVPIHFSEPDFNGPTPGCDGSGCHSFDDGIVSVIVTDLQVEVTVNSTTSSVGGELVDSNGLVVAVNNSTSNNPFTLVAPGPGTYFVNAGFKNPNPRRWDSAMVTIEITDVAENNTLHAGYKLFDNYPNPFNPSTILSYTIPEASLTSLKIYDAVGHELVVLVNEVKSAGTYEIEFNAEEFSSGIYFYELRAGSFIQTKKMILMK